MKEKEVSKETDDRHGEKDEVIKGLREADSN